GRRPVLLAAVALYLASTLACRRRAIGRSSDRRPPAAGYLGVRRDRLGARHRARRLFRRAGGTRAFAHGLDQRDGADCCADDRRRVAGHLRLARELLLHERRRTDRAAGGGTAAAGDAAARQPSPIAVGVLDDARL